MKPVDDDSGNSESEAGPAEQVEFSLRQDDGDEDGRMDVVVTLRILDGDGNYLYDETGPLNLTLRERNGPIVAEWSGHLKENHWSFSWPWTADIYTDIGPELNDLYRYDGHLVFTVNSTQETFDLEASMTYYADPL